MRVTLYTSDIGFVRLKLGAGCLGVEEQDFYFCNKFTVNLDDMDIDENDSGMYWVEKLDTVEFD